MFAVVHHGGAGTTAAGLHAGKPTGIVPFFGDQPFWGNMVAKAGAGPSSLPHPELTAEDLAEAIEFCKMPIAATAAKVMAEKMQSENGAEAAVASFHRHLDRQLLRRDLIPALSAIYEYTKNRKLDLNRSGIGAKVKLCGLAAELVEKSGLSYDILSTTNDFWYAPYKMYKREHRNANLDAKASSASSDQDSNMSGETAVKNHVSKSEYAKSTAKYAGASAVQIPKLIGVLTKGVCVDLPVAVTEGLRATPKLHGETVTDHEPITDVKSGLRVASKDLVVGGGRGLADLVVQPYMGAKERGIGGFVSGVGKGALGTVTKTSSAVLGSYAHTAQGVWRSIHSASHASVQKGILKTLRAQSGAFVQEEHGKVDVTDVVATFDRI